MMQRIPDDRSYVLVVEGPGDECVFEEFLKHLGRRDDVCLINCGGKDELARALTNILLDDNFPNLSHIGVICDNDYPESRNGKKPLEIVAGHVSTANSEVKTSHEPPREMPVPKEPRRFTPESPHVGVLLLPSDSCDGAVEDLVLKAIGQDNVMNCVDEYLKCLCNDGLKFQAARKARSRLSIYISGKVLDKKNANNDDSRREFLTQAVQMKWWNDENMWDNCVFDEAKAFLTQLLAD